MNIDWSKAPEGATHYRKSMAIWLKQDDRAWEWSGARWVLIADDLGEFRWSDNLIERPAETAWSGEGWPPVGAVCEYSIGEPTWYPCAIRYVLDCDHDPDADGWMAVIWCPHLEKEQVARGNHFKFRPIRTPEQIAAEERKKAVAEMAAAINSRPVVNLHEAALYALYDAGYRKIPDELAERVGK